MNLLGGALSARTETALANLQVWSGGLSALRRLSSCGIDCIVFKSLPGVEDLYGDAGGRRTTDVDVLVRSEDMPRALEELFRTGWKLQDELSFDLLRARIGFAEAARYQPWTLVDPVNAAATVIDLHPDSYRRDLPLDASVWARTGQVERDRVRFRTLGREDALVFLCWHAVSHFLDATRLADISLLLSQGAEIDWAFVRRRSKAAGLSGIVTIGCELALNVSLPATASRTAQAELPGYLLHQRLLKRILGTRLLARSSAVRQWLLRIGMLDRISDMVPMVRFVLLPEPLRLAGNSLGYWPGGRDYMRAVGRMYSGRLSARRPWGRRPAPPDVLGEERIPARPRSAWRSQPQLSAPDDEAHPSAQPASSSTGVLRSDPLPPSPDQSRGG